MEASQHEAIPSYTSSVLGQEWSEDDVCICSNLMALCRNKRRILTWWNSQCREQSVSAEPIIVNGNTGSRWRISYNEMLLLLLLLSSDHSGRFDCRNPLGVHPGERWILQITRKSLSMLQSGVFKKNAIRLEMWWGFPWKSVPPPVVRCSTQHLNEELQLH